MNPHTLALAAIALVVAALVLSSGDVQESCRTQHTVSYDTCLVEATR